MCISIIGTGYKVKYDSKKPLEEQLKGSPQVVIDYDPKECFEVDRFVDEVKRLRNKGIDASINVKVLPNNHIHGMQTKKQMKKLSKDMSLNEVVKLLVILQHKTDKTLEELSNFCCDMIE